MTNFYLDTHPDKHGDCAIRVSLRAGSARLLTSIGYSISPTLWDGNKMQVKPGTDKNPVRNSKGISAATINERIAAIKAIFARMEATPGELSKAALQAKLDLIKGKANKAAAQCNCTTPEALRYFDMFVAEESAAAQWSENTIKCMHAFRLHLQDFKANITFKDLNEAGLNKFIEFLRTRAITAARLARAETDKVEAIEALEAATTPSAKATAQAMLDRASKVLKNTAPEGMEEKSAHKYYRYLVWYLKWAIRKGYCTETAVQRMRPKFKVVRKPVIFLTRAELLKLYKFDIPANGTIVELTDQSGNKYNKVVGDQGGLARTRDLFCFCAFTSLRYSDMAQLKHTDISGDAIELTTQKTNDRLTIPLNDYSRAILEKYAGLNDHRGLALPVICNQRMNYYLKDLCELCGFNEPITKTFYRAGRRVEETTPKWQLIGTHAARRTFICYALTKGIAPQVIMKWTGHSDYTAMKPYIDIAGKDAAAAMQLMND